MLNGTTLNGGALDGRAAQPAAGRTLTAVLAVVALLGTPAPSLVPIVSAPVAPSAPTPARPQSQYVAPAAALPAAPSLPFISVPPIPAPLAILGSTIFIDLADPLVFAPPPIASAPRLPPPVPPAPKLPQITLVTHGVVTYQPVLGPWMITARGAAAFARAIARDLLAIDVQRREAAAIDIDRQDTDATSITRGTGP